MSDEIQDVQDQPTESKGIELTISDLKTLQNIIDAACQRGAFRAPELAAVGDVYNRLSAFIEAATKKA